MQALGFELGSRRADVRENVEKLQLPFEETGDTIRCQGQLLGSDAKMTWAFKHGRLLFLSFRWQVSSRSMSIVDYVVFRALRALKGAIV